MQVSFTPSPFATMAQYLVHGLYGLHCFQRPASIGEHEVIEWLKSSLEIAEGIPALHQTLRINATSAEGVSGVETWIGRLSLRIEGGKGGFGTLLRGGGQNKTGPVNNDSSRDLDGRRLRDAQALSKIQRALDKKEAALNGTPLEDSEEEEDPKKMKRKNRKQKKPKSEIEADKEDTDEAEKQEKWQAKQMKEAKIRQVHKEVVEETAEAVQIGFNASLTKSATATKPSRMNDMYGDVYAISSDEESDESDEEDDEESEDSDETLKSSAPVSSRAATSKTQESSSPSSSSSSSSSLESSNTQAKAVEADEEIAAPANRENAKRPHSSITEEPLIDLMKYDNSVALEALGLDKLKHELAARGLMVGGNLTQRAVRLFQVRGLKPEQYPADVLPKTKKSKN